MKNLAKVIICFFALLSSPSIAQVYVRGYTKSNGTYVAPHYRSSPNSTPTDNYSYPGNVNPFTGKVATGDPDAYLKNYIDRNNKTGSSNYGSYQYSLEDLKTQNLKIENLRREVEGNYQQNNNFPNSFPSSSPTATDLYINSILDSHSTPETYYVKQDTWIRKGPSKNHTPLQKASIAESIEIIENYSNGWSKVSFTYLTPNFNFIKKVGYIPTSRITLKAF